MGRGANESGTPDAINPGRRDLDRKHRVLVHNRARVFLRRNPEARSFTALDLVPDRDRLTDEEARARADTIATGLAQLEELGRVVGIESSTGEPAFKLTELGSSGMGR